MSLPAAVNTVQDTSDLFVMDDIIFVGVRKLTVRAKEQNEFKALAKLRMSVLLSAENGNDDAMAEDQRIIFRLNVLLKLVCSQAASLKFYRRFMVKPGRITRDVFLSVTDSACSGCLINTKKSNVIQLGDFQ